MDHTYLLSHEKHPTTIALMLYLVYRYRCSWVRGPGSSQLTWINSTPFDQRLEFLESSKMPHLPTFESFTKPPPRVSERLEFPAPRKKQVEHPRGQTLSSLYQKCLTSKCVSHHSHGSFFRIANPRPPHRPLLTEPTTFRPQSTKLWNTAFRVMLLSFTSFHPPLCSHCYLS